MHGLTSGDGKRNNGYRAHPRLYWLALSQTKIIDSDMSQPCFGKGFIEHPFIIKSLYILPFHKE